MAARPKKPVPAAPARALDQFDLFAPRSAPAHPEPAAIRPAPRNEVARVEVVAEPKVERAPAGPKVYSVGEITRELKDQIEQRFGFLAVQGEISNLSRPASGHCYFTLKDAEATLSAVLFRNQARALRFDLQNGQRVVCRGRLTLYPPRGQYQLACETIEPTGAGALALAFEQLKEKLSAEGLFDAARKRPVPLLPRRIGVVTSPSGAAVRDFLRVLHQRFPTLPVLIAPAKVQGEGAGREVAQAIRRLNAWSASRPERERLDVVVVTRGGGSLEDLWAFNEEVVARAIAESALPVVSAVGHEVDFTIADFVADLRCPTPTAAAERLAPEYVKELEQLAVRRRRVAKAIERVTAERRHALALKLGRLGDPRRDLAERRLALDERSNAMEVALRRWLTETGRALVQAKERLQRAHPRERLLRNERALRASRQALDAAMRIELARVRGELQALRERLAACTPEARLERARRDLSGKDAALQRHMAARLGASRRGFEAQRARLDALSPLKVMGRGYAIAFGPNGRALRRADEAKVGERVRVRLAEGELTASVEQVGGRSVE